MSIGRWSAALYVAVAAHLLLALVVAGVRPPQQIAGAALGLSRHAVELDPRDLLAMAPAPGLPAEPAMPLPLEPLQPRLQTDATADHGSRATLRPDAPPAASATRLAATVQRSEHAAGGGGHVTYLAILRSHLAAHRRSLDVDGSRAAQAVVEMEIAADGRLLSATLWRASGIAALDREALDLPQRAAPLPSPPGGGPLRLRVPVWIESLPQRPNS